MGCCGQGRAKLAATAAPGTTARGSVGAGAPPTAYRFTIWFQYVGGTALTVIGPVSGRRYRFTKPGVRLAVDPRDRPSLAKVPRLREVR